MKNKISIQQKIDALDNALRSFNFNEQYFIVADGYGKVFAIASNREIGGLNTHVGYMSYDNLNSYLRGYNDSQKGKFKPAIPLSLANEY